MHPNMQQALQSSVSYAPGPSSQPTDMETHIGRAQAVAARLATIHESALAVVGRLYGEGQAAKESAPTPRPAGLSSELTEALSTIEAIADRLESAVTRFSQFA